MGLMYARKLRAKKEIASNKAKAHAENHKAAHAAFAKHEMAKKEGSQDQASEAMEMPAKPKGKV